jgi:hypothetical protein
MHLKNAFKKMRFLNAFRGGNITLFFKHYLVM